MCPPISGPLQGVDISARDIAHPYGARINCSGNNAPVRYMHGPIDG